MGGGRGREIAKEVGEKEEQDEGSGSVDQLFEREKVEPLLVVMVEELLLLSFHGCYCAFSGKFNSIKRERERESESAIKKSWGVVVV